MTPTHGPVSLPSALEVTAPAAHAVVAGELSLHWTLHEAFVPPMVDCQAFDLLLYRGNEYAGQALSLGARMSATLSEEGDRFFTFDWPILMGVPTGTDYAVLITCSDSPATGTNAVFAYSPEFTILGSDIEAATDDNVSGSNGSIDAGVETELEKEAKEAADTEPLEEDDSPKPQNNDLTDDNAPAHDDGVSPSAGHNVDDDEPIYADDHSVGPPVALADDADDEDDHTGSDDDGKEEDGGNPASEGGVSEPGNYSYGYNSGDSSSESSGDTSENWYYYYYDDAEGKDAVDPSENGYNYYYDDAGGKDAKGPTNIGDWAKDEQAGGEWFSWDDEGGEIDRSSGRAVGKNTNIEPAWEKSPVLRHLIPAAGAAAVLILAALVYCIWSKCCQPNESTGMPPMNLGPAPGKATELARFNRMSTMSSAYKPVSRNDEEEDDDDEDDVGILHTASTPLNSSKTTVSSTIDSTASFKNTFEGIKKPNFVSGSSKVASKVKPEAASGEGRSLLAATKLEAGGDDGFGDGWGDDDWPDELDDPFGDALVDSSTLPRPAEVKSNSASGANDGTEDLLGLLG